MRITSQTVITETKDKRLYDYGCDIMKKTPLLYNASLFRIRQVFTGWGKEGKDLHSLQKQVFDELELTKEKYPSIKFRKVLSYTSLEKLMRATENPDFFSGLPMQTAQAIVKDAVQDFKNWLKALKDWKKNPDKYTGKPGMPKYCRSAKKTAHLTNQDCVLYPVHDENGKFVGMEMKLPLFKEERIPMPHLGPLDILKDVTLKPFYGRILMSLSMEVKAAPFFPEMPNMAGIDFGVDNIAALVCTDCSSFVYKGGAISSNNRLFAREKAKAVSILTKGTSGRHAVSSHLDNLSFWHDRFNHDQLHKISRDILTRCLEHKVGILVLGVNKNWKQGMNMGRRNNQNFASMPISRLRELIKYKAWEAGIYTAEQEESYTSKADISSKDPIPVYGKEKGKPVFSGHRAGRGRYLCKEGYYINADCNGAANILRKAVPSAWESCNDFRFLAYPESRGFHQLNPKYTKKVRA